MFSRSAILAWLLVLFSVCDCAREQDPGKPAASQLPDGAVQTSVSLCALTENPSQFNGKEVNIQAKFVFGFEWSFLFSEDCPGRPIWVEATHDLDAASAKSLKQAYDSGPTYLSLPSYLKLRGTFLSGGRYGHRRAYPYEIIARQIFNLLKIASETHMLTGTEGLAWKGYHASLSASIDKSAVSKAAETLQRGSKGRNSVAYDVLRDGSVPAGSVKIVSSSGTSELAELSRIAIQDAAPFDPLPAGFSQPFIRLCTVFYYNFDSLPEQTREANPYFRALTASIIEMEKAYGHLDDSMGSTRLRTDYRHMLIEKADGITEALPDHFGDYHLEYLDNQRMSVKFQKVKREFSVLRIQPANDGAILISLYWVSFRKGKLNFALSDWSEVRLLYDCENQTYNVSKVRLGGV